MNSPFQRELSIWADFNSRDADGGFKVSLRFAASPEIPEKGEWVRLYDDEGNAVLGSVEKVDGLIAYVRPEMTTWSSTEIEIDSPVSSGVRFHAALRR
jgi:hypothetical protein